MRRNDRLIPPRETAWSLRRSSSYSSDGHEAQRIPGQQVMVQQWEAIEIDIDGRTQKVRPVGSWVLQSNNVVAVGLALSLNRPLEWAVGFFFGKCGT